MDSRFCRRSRVLNSRSVGNMTLRFLSAGVPTPGTTEM
jgi:hypothetical protein